MLDQKNVKLGTYESRNTLEVDARDCKNAGMCGMVGGQRMGKAGGNRCPGWPGKFGEGQGWHGSNATLKPLQRNVAVAAALAIV